MQSNLHSEHKWTHKFTEVASGERQKQISCHSPFCVRMISYEELQSNLHAEHTQMHKFTEVARGERGKKFHVTHHTLRQSD